jgi:hypothetical protein
MTVAAPVFTPGIAAGARRRAPYPPQAALPLSERPAPSLRISRAVRPARGGLAMRTVIAPLEPEVQAQLDAIDQRLACIARR